MIAPDPFAKPEVRTHVTLQAEIMIEWPIEDADRLCYPQFLEDFEK